MTRQNKIVMEKTSETYIKRYTAAMHAVQTGVTIRMNKGNLNESHETDPKHLRVGVNSALIDSAAVVKLLIEKGIITENEYFLALAEQAEFEAQSYEDELGLERGTLR